jgi:SAM-dependent methyltransferase
MGYDRQAASHYDMDSEHALCPDEARVWLAEMRTLTGSGPAGRVLDVGAGTGLLTQVLKAAGLSVTGLEPSIAMIEAGLARGDALTRDDFVVGVADDADLFTPATFDWIVARQVLCHLTEPLRAFSAWRRWLAPEGRLLLVDGFWSASGWAPDALARQPFAALTGSRPVADALAEIGFCVIRSGPFTELDQVRPPGSARRYVIAAKPRAN